MNAKALKLIYLGKRSNMMPLQEEAQLFLLHPLSFQMCSCWQERAYESVTCRMTVTTRCV